MEKVTHNYDLEVPRNVTHEYATDKINNNKLWEEAIKKEMKNVRLTFDVKEKNTKIAPGHS